jgi:hypothetical protein
MSYLSGLSTDFATEVVIEEGENGLALIGSVAAVPEPVKPSGAKITRFVARAVTILKSAYDLEVGERQWFCMPAEVSALEIRPAGDPIAGLFADYLQRLASFPAHECIATYNHGDMLPRNLVATAGGLCLIDFEYCHSGCIYDEIGKLVAQSGLIESWNLKAIQQLVLAISEYSEVDVSLHGVMQAGLCWAGDYRWLSLAEARGRSDVRAYLDRDLRRIELLAAPTHPVWAYLD